jgi:ribonuclease HI
MVPEDEDAADVSTLEAEEAADEAEKKATAADTPEAAPAGRATGDGRDEGTAKVAMGLVLYTDAGSNPNPGPTGWGFHGYLYTDAKPAKGSGNGRWLLTRKGYVEKYDAAKRAGLAEVTPVHYVDAYGSMLATGEKKLTNNIGELMAAVRALQYAQDFEVERVMVRVDSEYVRRGMESWVDTWERNGWVKRGGESVPNVVLWKELAAARAHLVEHGVDVKFAWVKSHSHHLGNVLADKLATIGVALASQGICRNEVSSSTAQGYWKYDTGRHPMLANRCLYFNTVAQYQQPGVYYLGDHGKEDELLGKRMSDGAHTVVRLATPDTAIELVRNYTTELAGGFDAIVIVRLDQLYSATTHRELVAWGTAALLRPSAWRLDLNCLDEEPGGHTHKPLSRECRPPRIAMRAITAVSGLIERLRQYETRDAAITTTDLTENLYEQKEKPAGRNGEAATVTELRPEFGVGFAALNVMANYAVGGGNGAAPVTGTIPVTLTLGIDLLNRNSLKRLEKASPKITLVTWPESERAFRYATVVQAGDDICISAGTYSNLRVIP